MDRRSKGGRGTEGGGPTLGRLSLRLKSDLALMRLVREGYEVAFEAIVERYTPRLTKSAARLVGSDFANDAVQHALIAVHQLLLDPNRDLTKINLEAWLVRTVRNRSIDILRSQSYLVATEDMSKHMCSRRGSATAISDRERFSDLKRQIQDLPERQREVLLLREFEGRSYEEIADQLGTSPGAVNQLLIRARDALRDGVGMLLPLPLLRLWIDPSRLPLLRAERAMEWVSASNSTNLATKAAAVIVAAGAIVAGSVELKSQRPDGEAATRQAQTAEAPAQHGSERANDSASDNDKSAATNGAGQSASGPVVEDVRVDQVDSREHRPAEAQPIAKSQPRQKKDSAPAPPEVEPQPASIPNAAATVTINTAGNGAHDDLVIERPEIVIEDKNSKPNFLVAQRVGDEILVTEQSGEPINLGEASRACVYADSSLSTVKCRPLYQGKPTGLTVKGGEGDDLMFVQGENPMIAGYPAVILEGGPGDDQLVGSDDGDWLAGGAGLDVIWGYAGKDAIDGGSGFTKPNPDDGHDVLYGGDGDDLIFGDAGDDRLLGEAGNDNLQGMNGRDRMVGGPGEDFASGKAGSDIYDLKDGEKDTRPCPELDETLILDVDLDVVGPDWAGECGQTE